MAWIARVWLHLPGENQNAEDANDTKSSALPSSLFTSTASTTSSESRSCVSTTVRDCRVGCVMSILSADATTTICYTTSCSSNVGCSIEPITSTSINTSTRSQRRLKQEPTPYDIAATWSAFGMSTMAWYLDATLTITAMDAEYTDDMSEEDSEDLPLASETIPAVLATAASIENTSWCYVQ
jgi:hypothetical protein